MKETFLPGEIKQEYRGNESAIVTSPKQNPNRYDVFVYGIMEEEAIHLTGVWRANNDLKRVYIGLNKKAADLVTELNDDKEATPKKLETLDAKFIRPIFLE